MLCRPMFLTTMNCMMILFSRNSTKKPTSSFSLAFKIQAFACITVPVVVKPKTKNKTKPENYLPNPKCQTHVGSHQMSDSLKVKTGVRQGCLQSPFLFLLVIDRILKTTTSDRRSGIQWTVLTQLNDPNFADDLTPQSDAGQDNSSCNYISRN